MKCYNHHDRDAFGICTVCGKGLCLECMTGKKDVITCKDKKCINIFNLRRILLIFLYIVIIIALFVFIFD